MQGYNWSFWSAGLGWVFWLGIIILCFSGIGNWRYTYHVHKKYDDLYPKREALDVLDLRYAKGELGHEEYLRMKSAILGDVSAASRKAA